MLYFTRGSLLVYISSWFCGSCEHTVEYDRQTNGIFVATCGGAHTPTFLDAVVELCVIARRTMAAASEFLTSVLRITGASSEDEPEQVRMLVSDACGEVSRTLVILETASLCHHCGADEPDGRRFQCVICDGQVLSVLHDHVVEVLQPSMCSNMGIHR